MRDEDAPTPESARLPGPVVWGTFGVCLLPSLLNLVGADFSAAAQGQGARGPLLHTILEWTAFCVAVFSGVLALLRYRIVRDVATPVVGLALLLSGCLDAFHILVADRVIEARASAESAVPFTWAIGRLFHSLILLVGAGIFLVRSDRGDGARRRLLVLSALSFSAVAFALVLYCVRAETLPRTMYSGTFLQRPFDIVPLGVFLVLLGFVFPRFERRNPGLFANALVLSAVPAVLAQFHVAFGSSELYDNHFLVAHALKLVSYLVPLAGLLFDYVQILLRERETATSLLVANRTLAEKNRELDEFAHVASHDLQEPLRKINAFAELLEEDAGSALPELAREDLGFVRDGASHLSAVVQDLLQYARAGRSPLIAGTVPLDVCVDGALRSLSLSVRDKAAVVERAELPAVRGDAEMLTRLYQNLIANALKFCEGAPRVRITVEQGSGEPVFGVQDAGIGIPEGYRERIFEPFRRLHTRTEFPGTGVGLAICRRVVERHGGRIWVEESPGGGSHVKFTLQELRAEPVGPESRQADAGALP